MLAAYTSLQQAETVKRYLLSRGLLHQGFLPVKELGKIYFPLIKKAKIPAARLIDTKFNFPPRSKPQTIEAILRKKLTAQELSLLPRSQEIVGQILILEVPSVLEKKEQIIAEAYLQILKNIDTVVKKTEIHSGLFRTRKVKILAGKKSKETIHQENGIKIKLHLEKTYFSARSGNERLRLAKQIKPGEQVLVMFSGAAPFPLVLARNSPARMISAIELNPLAHAYAAENILLNKLENKIRLFHGDVRLVVPRLKQRFDRIAMPLPKTGEEFLDIALVAAKSGTIIHLYAFLEEKDVAAYRKKIKSITLACNAQVRILRKTNCGQFSPGTFRMCFDIKVI